MNATARFVRPLRPDSVQVMSAGYLAAAIWCADLTRAAQSQERSARTRGAEIRRLVPKAPARQASARPAAVLPFARAASR